MLVVRIVANVLSLIFSILISLIALLVVIGAVRLLGYILFTALPNSMP